MHMPREMTRQGLKACQTVSTPLLQPRRRYFTVGDLAEFGRFLLSERSKVSKAGMQTQGDKLEPKADQSCSAVEATSV